MLEGLKEGSYPGSVPAVPRPPASCPQQGGPPREPVRVQAPPFRGLVPAAQVPRRAPQTAPRGHAERAHVTAPPARHGRRGRHERLHRRARQAPRRDQHRGRDLHARHDRRAAPLRRAGARRPGPARGRGPVRRSRQGGAAGPAVRLHARRDAGVGGPPAGLLRPRPLALLALRPRRLAGRRALGRPPRARHAHHGQGQERRARRRATPPNPQRASSARPRSSAPPTASSRTPRRRPTSSYATTRRTPPRSPSSTPA